MATNDAATLKVKMMSEKQEARFNGVKIVRRIWQRCRTCCEYLHDFTVSNNHRSHRVAAKQPPPPPPSRKYASESSMKNRATAAVVRLRNEKHKSISRQIPKNSEW